MCCVWLLLLLAMTSLRAVRGRIWRHDRSVPGLQFRSRIRRRCATFAAECWRNYRQLWNTRTIVSVVDEHDSPGSNDPCDTHLSPSDPNRTVRAWIQHWARKRE